MRAEGSNRGVAQPYQPPVDLTGTRTQHGSHRAYGHYGCRCEACVEFRRAYERDAWELRRTYTHPRGRRIGQPRPFLTEESVREIRSSNEPNKILARRYGVTPSTIGHIRRRETWRHLP